MIVEDISKNTELLRSRLKTLFENYKGSTPVINLIRALWNICELPLLGGEELPASVINVLGDLICQWPSLTPKQRHDETLNVVSLFIQEFDASSHQVAVFKSFERSREALLTYSTAIEPRGPGGSYIRESIQTAIVQSAPENWQHRIEHNSSIRSDSRNEKLMTNITKFLEEVFNPQLLIAAEQTICWVIEAAYIDDEERYQVYRNQMEQLPQLESNIEMLYSTCLSCLNVSLKWVDEALNYLNSKGYIFSLKRPTSGEVTLFTPIQLGSKGQKLVEEAELQFSLKS